MSLRLVSGNEWRQWVEEWEVLEVIVHVGEQIVVDDLRDDMTPPILKGQHGERDAIPSID